MTLASIVEKESAQVDERPLIAGVYRNRLRIGMRLQSDPTVIYGIVQTRGSFDGDIRSRDLREDNAWNTYTRAGLPPGPIASPSIEAIRAVLFPADVPYLYFVARNDGSHEFSTNLTAHNAAVKRYQSRAPGRSGEESRMASAAEYFEKRVPAGVERAPGGAGRARRGRARSCWRRCARPTSRSRSRSARAARFHLVVERGEMRAAPRAHPDPVVTLGLSRSGLRAARGDRRARRRWRCSAAWAGIPTSR